MSEIPTDLQECKVALERIVHTLKRYPQWEECDGIARDIDHVACQAIDYMAGEIERRGASSRSNVQDIVKTWPSWRKKLLVAWVLSTLK